MIKTGGKDDSNHDYKTILKFDTDTLSWVQVGEMGWSGLLLSGPGRLTGLA